MEFSPEALEMKRKKSREYHKAWRDKNPGKSKEYLIKYWEKQVKLAKEAAEAEKENK